MSSDILEEISDVLSECRQCYDVRPVNPQMIDYIILRLDCCDESLRCHNTSAQLPEYSKLRELHICVNEVQLYWLTKLHGIEGISSSAEGRPKKVINMELVSYSVCLSTCIQ